MHVIEPFVRAFVDHIYIVSFLVGLLNEEAVLFLTILVSKSATHLQVIMIVAPIGLLCIDIVYSYLGRFIWMRRVSEKIHNAGEKQGILPKLIRFSHKHPLLALIVTKFIYGARIPINVYYRAKGMSLKTFILYDFVALEIWAFVMIPLAWLAGRGLTAGLHIVKDFSKIAGIAILLIILWYVVSWAVPIIIAKVIGQKKEVN